MEKKSEEQQMKNGEKKGKMEEGLPVESSPYTQYRDLEDYNRRGYGAEGHQERKPGRGGGSTDAPTPSGSGAVNPEAQLSVTDVVNRQGIP